MNYLCRQKYKLELHWDKLNYHDDSHITMVGAYFTGPVLKDAVQLEAPDYIDLDLTPQLLTVLDSYYIIRLDWKRVEYKSNGDIILFDATLTNDYLKSLHKLEDSDYIMVNTEKHEESTHAYHLVYEAQVIKEDKQPHEYRKS